MFDSRLKTPFNERTAKVSLYGVRPMLKHLCAAAAFACVIASPASADLFQANFAGTTGANAGTYPSNIGIGCPVVSMTGCTFVAGTPFTATFVFDTSLGDLSSPSSGT